MIGRRGLYGLCIALLLVTLVPVPAWARGDVEKDRAFLAGLFDTHVRPRVGAFAAAATDLAERMDRFCGTPDATGLTSAMEGWTLTMDAWAGVQHIRPGPLLLDARSDRIAFWPERRNIVARQLGQLLAARDPKALEPQGIRQQSAAVQGLTALERLLFGEDVSVAAFSTGEAGAYRCALGRSIARNVAALADEVRAGWTAIGPSLVAGQGTPVGETATVAVNNLYASAITMMQIVVDQKLLAPLGASLTDAKPAVAESHRAGRSLRAIAINLEALRAMLLGENGGPGFVSLLADTADGRALRTDVAGTFTEARAAIAAVPGRMERAVTDPKARPAVEAAFRAAKAAQTVMVQRLPPHLGIMVGFNELDGD